jgi:hypothetical protein
VIEILVSLRPQSVDRIETTQRDVDDDLAVSRLGVRELPDAWCLPKFLNDCCSH